MIFNITEYHYSMDKLEMQGKSDVNLSGGVNLKQGSNWRRPAKFL